jgi:4-amino-4-deoxy-L-arabinose transferase-like glycosyltransferase
MEAPRDILPIGGAPTALVRAEAALREAAAVTESIGRPRRRWLPAAALAALAALALALAAWWFAYNREGGDTVAKKAKAAPAVKRVAASAEAELDRCRPPAHLQGHELRVWLEVAREAGPPPSKGAVAVPGYVQDGHRVKARWQE